VAHHDLCTPSNIIRVIRSRKMRWSVHVPHLRAERSAYRILVGKPEGKRLLGRPRRRWEENITVDFKGMGWFGVD
jgi:hypothetical protein